MNQKFICDKCNITIEKSICHKCHKEVFIENNGIIDFVKRSLNEKNQVKISKLNQKIDESNFSKGVSDFIKDNPKFKNYFNDEEIFQSGDGLFHCLQENMNTCLEIGSGMGNTCETLSHNFNKVFSLELDSSLLEFQKRKFQNNKRKNIILIRSDFDKLPFPDNYFDFIICKEFSSKFSLSDTNGNNIIKEIQRILKADGFFYFTINNKKDFEIIKPKIGNFSKNRKNKREISYEKCSNVIESFGFKFKSYWSLPSFNTPLYSGMLDDQKSLSWFFKNLDKFLPKTKQISRKRQFIMAFLKASSPKMAGYFIKKYSPSFHFCCTIKGDFQKTIESNILEKTKSNTFLTLSRRLKIIYFLFDTQNKPKKIAIVKKFSYKSLDDICYEKIKKYKGIFDEDNRITFEDWKDGRMLDPLNQKEILAALDWVFNFQIETKKKELTVKDIEKEILEMNYSLAKHFSDDIFYKEWENDYKKYLEKNIIFKTSLHNDLSFRNFLIDESKNKIHAIDWERLRDEGNPIDDFIMFVYRTVISTNNESLDILEDKLSGNNSKFNKIMNNIDDQFFQHFGFRLNLLTIVRFHILRTIVIKGIKGHNIEKELKIIELLKKSNIIQHQEGKMSSN